MKKLIIFIILVTLFVVSVAFSKDKQKVVITIDDFSKKKISLAITTFKNISKKDLDPKGLEILDNISHSIENDLNLTGWFNIIDKKAFLVDEKEEGFKASEIQFQKWATLDALYLIKGSFEYLETKIKVNLFLYDVTSRKLLFAKSYEGLTETNRRIAHTFANDVVKNITGEPGIFTTKISAIMKKNGAKEIVYMDFDGKNVVQVTTARNINLCPRWSRDGTKIAFISKRGRFWGLFVADLVSHKISPVGKLDSNIFSVSFSPIEDVLAVTKEIDSDSEIVLMTEKGEMIKRLTNSFNVDVSPSWSPDGQKIVYTSSRTKRPQIYIMNKDGSNDRRLTIRGENDETPSWSPKGDVIAFAALDNDKEFDIFTVDTSGQNYQRLTYDSKNNEYPSWSPDGKFITFSSNRDGKYQIWIMNKDGSNQRRLTNGDYEYFSPDWSLNIK